MGILDLFHPRAAPFTFRGDNGEAVVLVHGFTGIPGHWRLAADFLIQRGFTVVAPLLPGHGTSVDDMAVTGAPDWLAAVVQSAMTVSDHRRIHLAGLSMGGLLAILAAGPVNAASVTTISAPLRFRRKGIYLSPFLYPFRPYTEWEPSRPPTEPETAELFLTYPGFPTRKAADLLVLARHARQAARRLRRPSLVVQSLTDESVDPVSARILLRSLGAQSQSLWLQHSRHNALLDRERGLIHDALLKRLTTG